MGGVAHALRTWRASGSKEKGKRRAYQRVLRELRAKMVIHEQRLHLLPSLLLRRDECRPAAATLVEHNRILRAILRHCRTLRVRVRVTALGHEVHADARGVVPEGDEQAVHDDAGREPVRVLVRDEEREAGVRGAVRGPGKTCRSHGGDEKNTPVTQERARGGHGVRRRGPVRTCDSIGAGALRRARSVLRAASRV
jgi:hypothetical protein